MRTCMYVVRGILCKQMLITCIYIYIILGSFRRTEISEIRSTRVDLLFVRARARGEWTCQCTHVGGQVRPLVRQHVRCRFVSTSVTKFSCTRTPHVHLFLEASKKHHLWNSKNNTKLYTSIESGKHHWHSRGCVPPQCAMPFETKSVNKSGLYGSLVDFFSSPSSVTTRHQCAAVRP